MYCIYLGGKILKLYRVSTKVLSICINFRTMTFIAWIWSISTEKLSTCYSYAMRSLKVSTSGKRSWMDVSTIRLTHPKTFDGSHTIPNCQYYTGCIGCSGIWSFTQSHCHKNCNGIEVGCLEWLSVHTLMFSEESGFCFYEWQLSDQSRRREGRQSQSCCDYWTLYYWKTWHRNLGRYRHGKLITSVSYLK